MATTTTKSPSAELAKLQQARDRAYAELQPIKRALADHDAETEAMKARNTAWRDSHPEEFTGSTYAPREGTEAAAMAAATRERMAAPNPHSDAYERARAAFGDADQAVQDFRVERMRDLIAEVKPEADAAREMIRSGDEVRLAGCELYRAAVDRVRSFVVAAPGFDGQDCGYDRRPEEWARLAREALDSEIIGPRLTDLGHWKVDRHGC